MRNLVASKLVLDWSPEQISGWLKDELPDDESVHVSHESYIAAYSYKRVACSKMSLSDICGPNAACVARTESLRTMRCEAGSQMRCQSASGQQKRRIEPCRVIGKGT